jgi:hypothetical protein
VTGFGAVVRRQEREGRADDNGVATDGVLLAVDSTVRQTMLRNDITN